MRGCDLLAAAMNRSSNGVAAKAVEGWPSDTCLRGAAAVVLSSDGLEGHVAKGRTAVLRARVAAGMGLGVLHFALEPADAEMAALFDEVLGGHFAAGHSVNPIWTLEQPSLAEHPVARGVRLGAVRDEWYFHIRFAGEVAPVLRGLPPPETVGKDGPRSGNALAREALAKGTPQTLAWVREARGGASGFGFTGGHFHTNWYDPGVLALVLNMAAWAAGADIPEGGLAWAAPAQPGQASIDEAIARGTLEDVKRFVFAEPRSVEHGRMEGLSPLHQALMRGKAEIAIFLIQSGADGNRKDRSGRTPLHLAVERNLPAAAAALLAAKADPGALDTTGWTPLHHAAAKNQKEMVGALLRGGAGPNTLSERGGTALHEAAASGGGEVIQLLLDAGCDPGVAAKDGTTALAVAKARGDAAVVERIERALRVDE